MEQWSDWDQSPTRTTLLGKREDHLSSPIEHVKPFLCVGGIKLFIVPSNQRASKTNVHQLAVSKCHLEINHWGNSSIVTPTFSYSYVILLKSPPTIQTSSCKLRSLRKRSYEKRRSDAFGLQ